jgi:hypothetical protein
MSLNQFEAIKSLGSWVGVKFRDGQEAGKGTFLALIQKVHFNFFYQMLKFIKFHQPSSIDLKLTTGPGISSTIS